MNIRGYFTVAVALLLLSTLSLPAKTADDEFKFRTTVEEVRLTLVALDRQHNYVTNLSPTAFAIIDNENIVRRFRSFAVLPEVSLNVVIVLDRTNSVTMKRRKEAQESVELITQAPWAERDRVSIVELERTGVAWSCLRSCEGIQPPDRLKQIRTNNLTALFDAIVLSTEALSVERDPLERTALIVFSDGEDNYSLNSVRNVITAAHDVDASVYSVNLSDDMHSRGSVAMEQMANATGGICFDSGEDAASVLSRVIEEMHAAYVVTYVPPERTAGLHQVRVLPARDLGLTLRSRQSYNYTPFAD